jgi:hypothetical protein
MSLLDAFCYLMLTIFTACVGLTTIHAILVGEVWIGLLLTGMYLGTILVLRQINKEEK